MVAERAGTFRKLNNPYTFGVPVRGEHFFGRDNELQLMIDTIENVQRGQKQDMVVVGPRRIGKSSLLYRLLDLLAPGQDFVPVYIDLQSIKPRTHRLLFLQILKRMKDGYHQKNLLNALPRFETLESTNLPEDMEWLTFGEDMEQLNRAIATRDLPRLVLLFDEIELLLDFGGRDTLDWFRSLIQRMTYAVFIVAGSEMLYSLTQDYGSPFYNIFKTVELRPLAQDVARRLIEEPARTIGMVIPGHSVERILHTTGNTPYFLQGILHYLVETLNREQRYEVYDHDIDSVLHQSVAHFSGQFSYLFWTSVSQAQRLILYALAKGQQPQHPDTILAWLPLLHHSISAEQQQELFDDLVRQHILRVEKDTKNNDTKNKKRYRFVVSLFAEWIISNVDNAEIIEMVTVPQPALLPVQTGEYSIGTAELRELLTKAMGAEELKVLMYDNFREVSEQLSSGMSKGRVIQQLLEYVERRGRKDELIRLLQRERPAYFEVFEKG